MKENLGIWFSLANGRMYLKCFYSTYSMHHRICMCAVHSFKCGILCETVVSTVASQRESQGFEPLWIFDILTSLSRVSATYQKHAWFCLNCLLLIDHIYEHLPVSICDPVTDKRTTLSTTNIWDWLHCRCIDLKSIQHFKCLNNSCEHLLHFSKIVQFQLCYISNCKNVARNQQSLRENFTESARRKITRDICDVT